jgi:hypothetical protein
MDLGSSEKEILRECERLLLSGDYSVDYWEGELEGESSLDYEWCLIRPAAENRRGGVIDPSWGGKCIFLVETGCKLSDFHSRPWGCRGIIPSKDKSCKGISKKAGAIAWKPYAKALWQLAERMETTQTLTSKGATK